MTHDQDHTPIDHDESAELQAIERWKQAQRLQMQQRFDDAIRLYQESIALYPTAEAHTFLGWTYSMMGQLHEAIQECLEAIRVDPRFGNPYNDIGAYLIELGRPDEAIPYLQKAMIAERYECYHYPHFNMARVLEHQGKWHAALKEYRTAIAHAPDQQYARHVEQAIDRLIGLLNPSFTTARALEQHGQWPDAIQAYRSAIAQAPDDQLVKYVVQAMYRLIGQMN